MRAFLLALLLSHSCCAGEVFFPSEGLYTSSMSAKAKRDEFTGSVLFRVVPLNCEATCPESDATISVSFGLSATEGERITPAMFLVTTRCTSTVNFEALWMKDVGAIALIGSRRLPLPLDYKFKVEGVESVETVSVSVPLEDVSESLSSKFSLRVGTIDIHVKEEGMSEIRQCLSLVPRGRYGDTEVKDHASSEKWMKKRAAELEEPGLPDPPRMNHGFPEPPKKPTASEKKELERKAMSTLRLGESMLEKGNNGGAKSFFESVIKRFPDADAAAKAKKYLEAK